MLENSSKYNFRRDTNPRNSLGLNTSYNGSAEKTQNPRVGRPGRSTDLPILQYRSTGPVDRTNPRVGVCQSRASGRPGRSTEQTRELGFVSQSPSVDRAGRPLQLLCMLCTSVDRTGRPTSVFFCCCCFFLPAVPLPFVVDSLAIFNSTWHECTSSTVLSPPTS